MTATLHRIALDDYIGGLEAVAERLPQAPAIYAFFRNITLPPIHDPDLFVASVRRVIEERCAPDHESGIGPLHKVVLRSQSQLSPQKETVLMRLSQCEQFRRLVRDVLENAAPLQAPLYVGKARRLQERFRQHIKPMSSLSVRLREAGISLDKCSLVYTLVDKRSAADSDEALLLVEEILTRLLRPGFVLRVG